MLLVRRNAQEEKKARSRVALQGFRHSASCHSGSCKRFPAHASQASWNVPKRASVLTRGSGSGFRTTKKSSQYGPSLVAWLNS